MSDDVEEGLGGGVDLGLLRRIARRDVLAVPTRDSLDPAAMVQPVSELLLKAFGQSGRRKPRDCAFVLSHYPDEDRRAFPAADVSRHLARQRSPEIFGRLHVVGSGLDFSLSMDVECGDIETLHAWLEERSLELRPLMIVNASDRKMLWYPDGIASERSSRELALGAATVIGAAEVDDALSIFHEAQTREHRTAAKYWHRAAGRVPCEHTETAIQEDLRLALEVRFAGVGKVDREAQFKGSKVDFAIYAKRAAGVFEPSCALELKVFREFHFPKGGGRPGKCSRATNLKALESGIEQAAVARDGMESPSALAYVASFDMRASDDDDLIDARREMAGKHVVACRRYYMESDAQSYRQGALGRRKVPAPPLGTTRRRAPKK